MLYKFSAANDDSEESGDSHDEEEEEDMEINQGINASNVSAALDATETWIGLLLWLNIE